MNREQFMKKLHPSITHINASDNMSEETVEAINVMVEKVLKMTSEETKFLVAESKKPNEVKEAQKYIIQCESDLGFMGSPDYYKAKKIVDDYHKSLVKEQESEIDQLRRERNSHREAEGKWESLMMRLVGEDGLGSVEEAINKLKSDKYTWYSQEEIRDFLMSKSYSVDVANELSKLWSDDLNGSYQKGKEKTEQEIGRALKDVKETLKWHMDNSGPSNTNNQETFFNLTANAIEIIDTILARK